MNYQRSAISSGSPLPCCRLEPTYMVLHSTVEYSYIVVNRSISINSEEKYGLVISGRIGEPEHQVCEREVRDQLPIPHQQVEPVLITGAEVGFST